MLAIPRRRRGALAPDDKEVIDEGSRVPRTGSEGVAGRTRSDDRGPDRCDRGGGHHPICGTDLHILKGDVPTVTDGRILGHEGVGTITEIGRAVRTLAVGDRVIISCITSCGVCSYLERA